MLILYSVAPIGRIFSYKNDTCICYNVTTVCKSSKQSGFIFLYIVRLRLSPNIFRMEGNKKKYLSKQIKLLTAQSYFRSFLYIHFFLVQLSSCLYDILQTCWFDLWILRCHKLEEKKGKII